MLSPPEDARLGRHRTNFRRALAGLRYWFAWARELVALVREITNEDLLCSFLNGIRPLQAITEHRRLKVGWDSRMSMFLDIVAALLALGMATTWVLTGGEKLPPDWALRTGSTDKVT
jgi:hypothetical protein